MTSLTSDTTAPTIEEKVVLLMPSLRPAEIEHVVTRLKQLVDSRELTQERLHELSGVAQPIISSVFRRSMIPSREQLESLSGALGLRLNDFLHDIPTSKDKLWGYLATPLTAVVGDPLAERELHRVVAVIESAARRVDSAFALYWPGRYTHTKKNSDVKADTVYRMDRAQASALDFIILLLVDPSYGVGQENEIASQAGLPAIRIASKSLSRMMSGSFLRGATVPFSGDLKKGIQIDEEALVTALEGVRLECYHQDALYDALRKEDFGSRLRHLVGKRCRDNEEFARGVGISLSYVHALYEEPLRVSNPSARLPAEDGHSASSDSERSTRRFR